MAVSEDEIIRRKLLIEGDGGNEDKRITNLLKFFIKYADGHADEENEETYNRILMSLTQLENATKKNLLVYNMNEKEQENYENLYKEIEQNIEDAHTKIEESKVELQDAKRVRKNRQEYDALAKVIQQHPNRQDSLSKLEQLDRERSGVLESQRALEEKLELRKKQFHLLITAIHDMQHILDADDTPEPGEEGSAEMDTT